jgi:hypothetical protein
MIISAKFTTDQVGIPSTPKSGISVPKRLRVAVPSGKTREASPVLAGVTSVSEGAMDGVRDGLDELADGVEAVGSLASAGSSLGSSSQVAVSTTSALGIVRRSPAVSMLPKEAAQPWNT